MKSISTLLVFLISAIAVISAQAEETTHHNNLSNGLAIKGYDPVAYFINDKAIKGEPQYSHTYKSARYQFSSQKNLEIFKASPSLYEPQYGGWCAYAFAEGAGKVSINPKRFKIINNKLYLFYDTLLGPNTLKKWNKADDTTQVKKATSQWAKILAQ